MRKSVRDLIVDACDESRLVNRNQPIPGSIFESALILLKKRVNQYSNTNLLSFIRKEVNFVPHKSRINIGTYELLDGYEKGINFFDVKSHDDLPDANTVDVNSKALVREYQGEYAPWISFITSVPGGKVWVDHSSLPIESQFKVWPDVEANKLQDVVKVYARPQGSDSETWDELTFVAYEDFYSVAYSDDVYSVLPVDDEHVTLFIKDSLKDYELKVIYNEAFEIDTDTEFNIPRQFISLFTAGLVYDLALQYPRLSDNTVALLRDRLNELESNVRRSTAKNKFITRQVSRGCFGLNDFIAGRFIGI